MRRSSWIFRRHVHCSSYSGVPKKKATRTTTFPSYTDAEPMAWGVSQIGECNGADVAPMVFSYSHVDAKNRQGHFDVVAIAGQTMTYSQLARVKSFFRELNHNENKNTDSIFSKAECGNSPKSPSSKSAAMMTTTWLPRPQRSFRRLKQCSI